MTCADPVDDAVEFPGVPGLTDEAAVRMNITALKRRQAFSSPLSSSKEGSRHFRSTECRRRMAYHGLSASIAVTTIHELTRDIQPVHP